MPLTLRRSHQAGARQNVLNKDLPSGRVGTLLPASMLTDNGSVFTTESRRGACAIIWHDGPHRTDPDPPGAPAHEPRA